MSETGAFVITGFVLREAIAVAELKDGMLVPVGIVKSGFAGKELWPRLEPLHADPETRSGLIPMRWPIPSAGDEDCNPRDRALASALPYWRSPTIPRP